MPNACPFCNIEHKTTVPTVHLNGTSPERLYESLRAAADALHQADFLLREAAPNGRDYYPQGDGATQLAMSLHERRWKELDRMIEELEEMCDHVQAVINFQEANKRSR
ncbi:MAG TPA: hypothetical protein VGG62_17820 [Terracidiphilus sp.]